MKTNISVNGFTRYVAVAVAGFTKNTHGGTWIDTDISAAVPAVARAVFVNCTPTKAGGDFVGVREAGSAVNCSQGIGAGIFVSQIAGITTSQHIEMKDDTGAAGEANNYYVLGYFT